ncbi:MAG: c-type cytochrome [Polyangiales bacterium]
MGCSRRRPSHVVAAAAIGWGTLGATLASCASQAADSPSDAAETSPIVDGAADTIGVIEVIGATDATDAAPEADATTPIDSTFAEVPSPGPDAADDVWVPTVIVVASAIVTVDGSPLQVAPGGALRLKVRLTLSDGSMATPAPEDVTWSEPQTLVAMDPNDAGSNLMPEIGAQPTAFFVANPYRDDQPGTLYVLDRGSVAAPSVFPSAIVAGVGLVTAEVTILPTPVGDAVNGQALYQHIIMCATCHGDTGGGSPPATLPDGGLDLLDGAIAYRISGELYPYPAPGLNAAPDSGNVAADPAWNMASFAVASQSDLDNHGVALRMPMPYWLGGTAADGGTIQAQDFADMYAWLRTQTK